MLAFDLDFQTEALKSPQQNKSSLARRLQKTQKSAFIPQTYTKSLFNHDNNQEYEYCNQKFNLIAVDKSVQKNSRGVSQRRRSKKKPAQLESLTQTKFTPIYENYAKIQRQPQFHQFLIQKSIIELQTQSYIYETRRKAKRRQNKKIELQYQSNQKPQQVTQQHPQQINHQLEFKQRQIADSPIQNSHKSQENTNTQMIQTSSKVVDSCLQKDQLFAGLEQKSYQQIDMSNMKPLIQESSKQIKNQELTKDFENQSPIKCLLVRDKDGFNCFWPQFHLYSGPHKKHIMSAKKTSTKPTSTFIISRSKTNFQQNTQFYLGKMKSNILGNVLNIFGTGLNPSNAKEKNMAPRELIASIHYITDIFRDKPKEFQVFVKKAQYSYYSDFPQVKMYEDEISLNQLHQFAQNKQKMKVFKNRKAYWNKNVGGYTLDFKGRVKIASSKNFILEQNQNGPESVLFGKLDECNFNLDIFQSVQPLVAFAVALSSFDSRLCD